MKILFVLEYYYPYIGGVETLFRQLAESLAKNKNNEIAVITSRPKNQKNSTANINGVNIHWVSTPNRYLFTFLSFFKTIFLAKNFDLVHTTTYNAAFPAWLAAKLCHKKIIITVHEIFDDLWFRFPGMSYFSKLFHSAYEKLILLLPFDQYVCVSESTKICLLKHKRSAIGKTTVIYNGIDYSHWDKDKYKKINLVKKFGLDGKKNYFFYLYYGRPGVSKGVEYLIDAVPEISKRVPNSKLILLLGKNPLSRYKKILTKIKEKKLTDKIVLIEPVDYNELPAYIKSNDCVVVTSLSEGFGYSVVESAAMGVPIVASSNGSIPEVISGNFILLQENNKEAIAQGVTDVYNKKLTKKSLRKFTLDQTVQEYTKAYSQLV